MCPRMTTQPGRLEDELAQISRVVALATGSGKRTESHTPQTAALQVLPVETSEETVASPCCVTSRSRRASLSAGSCSLPSAPFTWSAPVFLSFSRLKLLK